jgi:hypothetical protein
MHSEREILLARDLPGETLSRARRAGAVRTVRRGAYLAAEHAEPTVADRARALVLQLGPDAVLSHETAAVLLGCRTWRTPRVTHVVRGYRRSGHASRDVVWHFGSVPADQRTSVAGLTITSPERTVLDCALDLHPLAALVIADSALRLPDPLDLEVARRMLAESPRRNGRVRARWVLDHADAGADSPWETWARYVCLRAGMPRPRTQAPVVTAERTYHCDLGWHEHGVYLEFDGRSKYATSGQEELWREKLRFDAIRATGINPVRVTATGPGGVARVVARVSARFPDVVAAGFRVNRNLPLPD